MPIPDFQTIMLPLLQHLSDGREHPNQETIDALAKKFGLSTEELTELLPSGAQPVFTNRVAWAKTHMKMAGLVDAPKRAVYRITDRGRNLLASKPEAINMSTLAEYEEYLEFRTRKRKNGEALTDLMIDFNIGVTGLDTYEIKRLDSDYFEEV